MKRAALILAALAGLSVGSLVATWKAYQKLDKSGDLWGEEED